MASSVYQPAINSGILAFGLVGDQDQAVAITVDLTAGQVTVDPDAPVSLALDDIRAAPFDESAADSCKQDLNVILE